MTSDLSATLGWAGKTQRLGRSEYYQGDLKTEVSSEQVIGPSHPATQPINVPCSSRFQGVSLVLDLFLRPSLTFPVANRDLSPRPLEFGRA